MSSAVLKVKVTFVVTQVQESLHLDCHDYKLSVCVYLDTNSVIGLIKF